nr:anti-sigma factor [Mucilaginibacter sp. Bleaf8]
MYADVHDIEPADELRHRILNSLMTNLGDDRTFSKGKYNQPEARVAPIKPATTSIFYKYAFAASILLLCLCGGALVMVLNRLQNARQQLVTYQLQNQKFTRQVSQMDEEIAVFRDTTFRFVKLKGTAKMPQANVTVAWSSQRKKVMLDVATAALPAPDKGHQYQLWAIANGKPVDLGVFDAAEADSTKMMEMKSTGEAQAFAITLEPTGGSPKPTTEPLVIAAL